MLVRREDFGHKKQSGFEAEFPGTVADMSGNTVVLRGQLSPKDKLHVASFLLLPEKNNLYRMGRLSKAGTGRRAERGDRPPRARKTLVAVVCQDAAPSGETFVHDNGHPTCFLSCHQDPMFTPPQSENLTT